MDGEEAKECVDEVGDRTMCVRHADDASSCSIHQAALAIIAEGCIGNVINVTIRNAPQN